MKLNPGIIIMGVILAAGAGAVIIASTAAPLPPEQATAAPEPTPATPAAPATPPGVPTTGRAPACPKREALDALQAAALRNDGEAFKRLFSLGGCFDLPAGTRVEVLTRTLTAVEARRPGDTETYWTTSEALR